MTTFSSIGLGVHHSIPKGAISLARQIIKSPLFWRVDLLRPGAGHKPGYTYSPSVDLLVYLDPNKLRLPLQTAANSREQSAAEQRVEDAINRWTKNVSFTDTALGDVPVTFFFHVRTKRGSSPIGVHDPPRYFVIAWGAGPALVETDPLSPDDTVRILATR